VGVNKGVLHRDAFAKYAVAFRRISISSLALASSLRSRLFLASNSLTGRLTLWLPRCARVMIAVLSLAFVPSCQRCYWHSEPMSSLVLANRLGQACRFGLELFRVLPFHYLLLFQ
jgi:hypothetical protein